MFVCLHAPTCALAQRDASGVFFLNLLLSFSFADFFTVHFCHGISQNKFFFSFILPKVNFHDAKHSYLVLKYFTTPKGKLRRANEKANLDA